MTTKKYSVTIRSLSSDFETNILLDTIDAVFQYIKYVSPFDMLDGQRFETIRQLNHGHVAEFKFGDCSIVIDKIETSASSAVFDKDEAEYEDHYFKTWTNHGARIDANS